MLFGPRKGGASAPPHRRPNRKIVENVGARFAALKPRPFGARHNTFSSAVKNVHIIIYRNHATNFNIENRG